MKKSKESIHRRDFVKSSATGVGLLAGGPLVGAWSAGSSPNETINVAVMGIRGQGAFHIRNYLKLPNVRVAGICDIDERLFPMVMAQVEEASGKRPRTETDVRRVLEDKDIDAISIAAPNHWHALATIWACQAGKDVYVEKPVSYCIVEGRREAATEYRRIAQVGTHHRSRPIMRSAVEYLHSGKLGKIYMIRCLCFRPREDIGRKPDSPVHPGVHYDLWLGPAADRPFNEGRFHYNWHWFWDTGNGETGNNGPHMTDLARHILKKIEHPQRIVSMGGLDVLPGTQETPNTQFSLMEYTDGTRVQLEVRGLYTNTEDGITMGLLVYGSEGWMRVGFDGWASFFGRGNEPGKSCGEADANARSEEFQKFGSSDPLHYANFIACMRSRKATDLRTNIAEGHLSAPCATWGTLPIEQDAPYSSTPPPNGLLATRKPAGSSRARIASLLSFRRRSSRWLPPRLEADRHFEALVGLSQVQVATHSSNCLTWRQPRHLLCAPRKADCEVELPCSHGFGSVGHRTTAVRDHRARVLGDCSLKENGKQQPTERML